MELSLQDLIATPVVTASRQAETRDQTPAQIIVFTREQIRQRRYKNLADLLFDLPGVDFQRGTKSSQFNQFAIQGYLGPNKLLIMQDGVRIAHPGGGNFPVAENLALYHAKQVEVLYGPAAALYGADAVAGVINIITETGGQGQSAVSLGAGRFDGQEASFFTSAQISEQLGISAGGHKQQSDRAPLDHFYPAYFQQVDGDFGGATILPAATREAYAGKISSHSLFARVDLAEQLTLGLHRSRFNSLTSTGDPLATAQYDPGAQWQTTNDTYYAQYRFRLNDDLDAQLSIDHGRLEVAPKAYYNNVYNGFAPGYSYVRGERTAIEQTFNWRINQNQQLQAGLGWQRFYDIEVGSLPQSFDKGKPVGAQGMSHMNTPLPLIPLDARFRNALGYLQLQSQWTTAFSTVAGLRVDKHSSYGTSINPRLGAVYKPSEQHVFKLMFGQAFRAPSPEERLSTYGMFDGIEKDTDGRYVGHYFRIPSLDLQPEKARTLSTAWDWRPTPNLNLNTHLYYSRISNLVVNKVLAGNDTQSIPGAVLITPDIKGNAGQQWQSGLDFSAQWRFSLNQDWTGDLWGSASYVHGRVDEGNGVSWDIPYVARHKIKLGTTLRWRESITITPKIYWTDEVTNGRTKAPGSNLLPPASCQTTMQAPERCTTPGYTLVDLHLGWHKLLAGKATVWLDIYNLFDRRYHAAAGAGSLTFWDMPQQPRSWMLSLDYQF
ncbi:MAG: TonB-dependent receptor [Sterolibacterium sp.]|nr:TonB-dependent receptor [Sterolibacterium sp.]